MDCSRRLSERRACDHPVSHLGQKPAQRLLKEEFPLRGQGVVYPRTDRHQERRRGAQGLLSGRVCGEQGIDERLYEVAERRIEWGISHTTSV